MQSQASVTVLPTSLRTSDALSPTFPQVAAARAPWVLSGARDNSRPLHPLPAHRDPLSVLHTACARQGNGLCLS